MKSSLARSHFDSIFRHIFRYRFVVIAIPLTLWGFSLFEGFRAKFLVQYLRPAPWRREGSRQKRWELFKSWKLHTVTFVVSFDVLNILSRYCERYLWIILDSHLFAGRICLVFGIDVKDRNQKTSNEKRNQKVEAGVSTGLRESLLRKSLPLISTSLKLRKFTD